MLSVVFSILCLEYSVKAWQSLSISVKLFGI